MKVWDLALKDMLRSLRSFFMVGMTLVAPLLITGLIYFSLGGLSSGKITLPPLHVGWVNQDVPPAGQPALGELLTAMLSDASVSEWLIARELPDEATARAALDRQEIGLAVLIPADFSAVILSGQGETRLLLVQDPTLTIGPVVVKDMITMFLDGAMGTRVALIVVAERQAAQGAALDAVGAQRLGAQFQEWYAAFQRELYHQQTILARRAPSADGAPAADSIQQMLALIMAGQMIFFGFYTGAYAMMSILREQEEGTLARLFSTPTPRTVILAGTLLAVVLTVLAQCLVMLFVGVLVFGVRWGQPSSVVLAVLGQVAAASGLGVLLISLVKTTRQAGPVLGGGLTALGMAGGLFTVAVPNIGKQFELVSLFTPQGWVIRGWKVALAGASAAEMLLPLLVTVAMGVVMFTIGAALFRRRLA